MRGKHPFRLRVCVLAVLLLSVAPARAITYWEDGGYHVIDILVGESTVRNDSFWGNPTTIELIKGGRIAYDLCVEDTSVALLTDGSIDNRVFAYNSSTVTISGASIGNFVSARDDSTVTMSAGSVTTALSASGTAHLAISGGSMLNLSASDSSDVTISGGHIRLGISAFDDAALLITGGQIDREIVAQGNATLTIDGYGLEIYDQPVDYGVFTTAGGGSLWGTLTGFYAGGAPLDIDFRIDGNATLTLIPEPTSLLLFLPLMLLRRRR